MTAAAALLLRSMPSPAMRTTTESGGTVEGRTWPAGAGDACAGKQGEVASCMCSCTPSVQRIGARTEPDGPPLPRRRFRRIQRARSRLSHGHGCREPAEAAGGRWRGGAGGGKQGGRRRTEAPLLHRQPRAPAMFPVRAPFVVSFPFCSFCTVFGASCSPVSFKRYTIFSKCTSSVLDHVELSKQTTSITSSELYYLFLLCESNLVCLCVLSECQIGQNGSNLFDGDLNFPSL